MNDRESRLHRLLSDHGFDWAINNFSPPDAAARFYLQRLDDLQQLMVSRNLGESGPTLEILEQLCKHSSFKASALLEAIVSIQSAEISCAAWRIIQGMTVEEMSVQFVSMRSFELIVRLRSPYGKVEVYRGEDINDLNFVRHLSKSKSGDGPLINGFHALRRHH